MNKHKRLKLVKFGVVQDMAALEAWDSFGLDASALIRLLNLTHNKINCSVKLIMIKTITT